MRKYLLPEGGKFFKANLHCHTTVSDGKRTPEEIKELYKKNGYSIVAYTDHDIMIPHDDLNDEDFLAMIGYEMEINAPVTPKGEPFKQHKTCHICMVGLSPDVKQVCWHRSKYLFGNAPNYREFARFDDSIPDFERSYNPECINEIMRRGREGGFFVTYNHPVWSQEEFTDYIKYEGMHAMEIVNYSCLNSGFDDYNPKIYDDILRSGKRIYCAANDDNHNNQPDDSPKSDSLGGFNMIKAEKLDYEHIGKALLAGDFYASEGPIITSLYVEDGNVFVECENAKRINYHSDIRQSRSAAAPKDGYITSASFPIGENHKYFRITVIDEQGRHADTRAYFVDELEA